MLYCFEYRELYYASDCFIPMRRLLGIELSIDARFDVSIRTREKPESSEGFLANNSLNSQNPGRPTHKWYVTGGLNNMNKI